MTINKSCDWCGNAGHAATDHPLPQSHPHYAPELDDNPVMDLALDSFNDFAARQQVESTKSATASLSPIGRLLGAPGTGPTCNGTVHWWRTDAKSGDPCLCGAKSQTR